MLRVIILVFLLQFSLFGASRESFSYPDLKSAITSKNLSLIFEIKEELEEKFSDCSLEDSLSKTIERLLRTDLSITSEEIKIIKSTLNRPTVGEFLGALFFPHSSFENTVKTNFNQLPFFERALILISADLGFKPARNIIVLANNEKVNLKTITNEQGLYKLLSILFAAENGMVVRKAKEILNDGAKQDAFFKSLSGAASTVLMNAGYIYQFLERPELAAHNFEIASNNRSRRGAIEYGFIILEKDLSRADEFITRLNELEMKPYAFWKLAQYHRYGTSTPRDISVANNYYLLALEGGSEFPEIYYDAGDFAEYFACSQTDKGKRIKALEQALEHYRLATIGGIREGYRKQVEITKKIGMLRSLDVGQRIADLASEAARHYFIHAANLLKNVGIEIPMTEEWIDLEQCIDKYPAYLSGVLSSAKKCPLSF